MDIDIDVDCELIELEEETQDKRESNEYSCSEEKLTVSIDKLTQGISNILKLLWSDLYKDISSSSDNYWCKPWDKVYFSGFDKKKRNKHSLTQSDQLKYNQLRRKLLPYYESKSLCEKLANCLASTDKVLKRKFKKKVKVKSLTDLSMKSICLTCSKMCLLSSDLHCLHFFCPVEHVGLNLNFLEALKKQKYCFSKLIHFFRTFFCDLNKDVLLKELLSADLMRRYILLSYQSITQSLNFNVECLSMKISNQIKPEIDCVEKELPVSSDLCCTGEAVVFTDSGHDLYTVPSCHLDFTIQLRTCCATCCSKGTEGNKELCDSDKSFEDTHNFIKESGTRLQKKERTIDENEKENEKHLVKQTELEKAHTKKFSFSKDMKRQENGDMDSLFPTADVERTILMELVASDSIYLHYVGHSARESALAGLEVYMMRSPATHTRPDKVMGIPWANFERETLRMASFSSYPERATQSAALLADSGFIYIGEGKSDKVICFFCYMVKENWKREDDIFLVHKSMSPHCPIVLVLQMNNVASITGSNRAIGNSPASINSLNQSTSAVNQSSQSVNQNAVFAPSNAPNSNSRNTLNFGSTAAQITLSQATPLQTVQTLLDSNSQTGQQSMAPSSVERSSNSLPAVPNPILQLNRTIRPLISNANSSIQHTTHPNINSQIYSIPRMPLSVQPVYPSSSNESDAPVRDLNLQDLGIFHERPKKPEFAILAKREESFDGWPPECPVSKDLVAKSGVYYEGYGDSGRCFFCGGGLRKWELGDDPFVEHARWYPRCGYLRQYMGQSFVDVVQEIKSKNNQSLQITREMVLQVMRRRGLTIANEFDEAPLENDPAVKSVLDEFKETQTYSREEIIQTAKALRHNGVTLSSDELYGKLSQIRQRQPPEQPQPVAGATAAVGSTVTEEAIEALKEENSTLRNNLICKICMDKEVKIVFLPCGHLVSCQECSVAFVDCPICRSHIRAYVRATIH